MDNEHYNEMVVRGLSPKLQRLEASRRARLNMPQRSDEESRPDAAPEKQRDEGAAAWFTGLFAS